MEVLCGASRFRLQTLPPEDYPAVPGGEISKGIALPLDIFQAMVERSLFAVTREDSRFALNGALLELEGKSASVVATDGHRLAVVRKEMPVKGVKDPLNAIVPKKTLNEILRMRAVAEGEGEERETPLLFATEENHLHFKLGERHLVSRTLEGTFPNYDRVLPKENDKVVRVGRDPLTEALRRVALLSYEKSRALRLKLEPGGLTVTSSTPEVGEAEERVEVSYDGEPMEIVFNGDYLLEWLGKVGSEEVEMNLRDGETQGLFTPAGSYPYDYRYVIMPMRL
jgi:DNA polymerase-3 subunit beta